MYSWITLLYTWNYHNIVNQLYFNIKEKIKKKDARRNVVQCRRNNKHLLKLWDLNKALCSHAPDLTLTPGLVFLATFVFDLCPSHLLPWEMFAQ